MLFTAEEHLSSLGWIVGRIRTLVAESIAGAVLWLLDFKYLGYNLISVSYLS